MQKIMFSEKFGLQQAVLNGSKTMTRRIEPSLKVLPEKLDDEEYIMQTIREDSILVERCYKAAKLSSWVIRPRFHLFEKIAVAQCYEDAILDVGEEEWNKQHKWYCIENLRKRAGLHNKMFVRSDLMPHQIEITDYRVERLQQISDDDCLKEGIIKRDDLIDSQMNNIVRYTFEGSFEDHIYKTYKSPREAFAALIGKISGKKCWERNPWVLVYSFRLVK